MENDGAVKLPENCPICGAKMEGGYVTCGASALNWTKEKQKIGPIIFKEVLVGERIFAREPPNAEACRCPKCKIVIFSYGEEKEE